MPRDLQDPHSARPSIRFAVLELVASDATGDESQFLAALRQIVDDGRSRAADLVGSLPRRRHRLPRPAFRALRRLKPASRAAHARVTRPGA